MQDEEVGSARNTLWHELGHFYFDKLAEYCKCKDESIHDPQRTHPFVARIVDEGIGTYFDRAEKPKTDIFSDSMWAELNGEKKVGTDYRFYRGGYHLVKPIIDRYSTLGMIYLLQHPPMVKSLTELPAYQKKALEDLAKEEARYRALQDLNQENARQRALFFFPKSSPSFINPHPKER
jgi:hypothetical protein